MITEKCPSVKDLSSLLFLESPFRGEKDHILDDASLEVMLRIEKSLQRLRPMGTDACRALWIEVIPPDEDDDMEWYDEKDSNGRCWIKILSSHYRKFHDMWLTNFCDFTTAVQNMHHIGDERKPGDCDVKAPLLILEKYIGAIVEDVLRNPEDYNNHVEKYLPYNKRCGHIRRKTLGGIIPSYAPDKKAVKEIDFLKEYGKRPVKTYKNLTLREYIHWWRTAYAAASSKSRKDKEYYSAKSDEEIFSAYSPRGRELFRYDLDSPVDFLKWIDEEGPYHSMGVFYVSIILYAFRENEGFRLHLSANTDAYFKETMAILRAFASEDSGVEFSSWSGLVDTLQGKDMIHFSPQPNRYHGEEYLPGPDRNISRKMVEQVIANTKWERVSKLKARQK